MNVNTIPMTEATVADEALSFPSSLHFMVCTLKLILLSLDDLFQVRDIERASFSLSNCLLSVWLTKRLSSAGTCFSEYRVAALGLFSKSSVILRKANTSLSPPDDIRLTFYRCG